MKHSFKKIAVTSLLTLSLATGSLMLSVPGALAANNGFSSNRQSGMMNGTQNAVVQLAETAGEIVSGTTTNSAASLSADTENATAIIVTDEDSQVKITESGTYVISGSASDGSITVKKGTTGVVLILEDLDLTSTTGAALSVNKDSEVQIVVSGSVTLTDAENPDDETSEDAEVADAYDGAALKVKAGSSVYLTGDGTLTVNGTAKNGIKTGEAATLVIDGENLTVDITAANDGINASYDLTIASGSVTVSATDDAIHADRVLTLGTEDNSTSPTVTVKSSTEGLEGTVVNIYSGTVSVTSSDDAINAANKDGLYEAEMGYSINITGGDVTISSRSDGLDSNGNINLTGGSVTIRSSASNGGDAGMDYDGSLYISQEASMNNGFGIAGPDQMGGMRGQMGGQFGQWGQNGQMNRQMGQNPFDNQDSQNGSASQQMTLPDRTQERQKQSDSQQAPETDLNTQATQRGKQSGGMGMEQEEQSAVDGQQMTPPDQEGNGQLNPGDQQQMPFGFGQQGGFFPGNGQQEQGPFGGNQPQFGQGNGWPNDRGQQPMGGGRDFGGMAPGHQKDSF